MNASHFSKVPWWVLALIANGTLSGATLVTYVALGRHANWKTGTGAWPSVETLMGETGLSERTIRGHVKALTEAGVIRKTERFVQGQQTTNLIELLQDPGVPFVEVQDSAGLGVQDSAPKQDPIEQDAAAVLEVGDQQQQNAVEMAMDTPAPGYPEGTGSAFPDPDQQQHGDAPAETMEEAVAVIAETLGGEVVADTQQPRVWVCDGCMRPVVREQIADMVDGEHVLCVDCKDAVPHGGAAETIAEQMARSGHGVRGTHLNPNPEPGRPRPFPVVQQRTLQAWFNVTDGAPWEAAWNTACQAPTDVFYDPAAHMAIYLSRCREERRVPRSDLWLRFFIEDRAKHIQTLQHEADAATRREEDPQQREERSNRSLPPVWGDGEGA